MSRSRIYIHILYILYIFVLFCVNEIQSSIPANNIWAMQKTVPWLFRVFFGDEKLKGIIYKPLKGSLQTIYLGFPRDRGSRPEIQKVWKESSSNPGGGDENENVEFKNRWKCLSSGAEWMDLVPSAFTLCYGVSVVLVFFFALWIAGGFHPKDGCNLYCFYITLIYINEWLVAGKCWWSLLVWQISSRNKNLFLYN